MSLQQLITDIRDRHDSETDLLDSIIKHEQIILDNPELLKGLDKDAMVTLLRESAFFGLYKIAKFVIDFGSDFIDPLELALIEGNVQLVESLLRVGKKFEDIEWGNIHPGTYIFREKNVNTRKEIVTLLLKFGSAGFQNENGGNWLHSLIYNSEEEEDDQETVDIAEMLINYGLSVDEPDNEGCTPLFLSVVDNKMVLTKFLIEKGADVNRKNLLNQRSPLSMAVQFNNLEIVDLLVSNGATDVNQKIPSHIPINPGLTALHVACIHNSVKLIKKLILEGAYVSIEDNEGNTPFSLLNVIGDDYDQCQIIFIKEISKLSFENLQVSKGDWELIQETLKSQEHFEKCQMELEKMSSLKFYGPHSYYSVLKMSENIEKLAELTKNEDFVSSFCANLRDFSYYKADLQRIFEEAVQVREKLETGKKN